MLPFLVLRPDATPTPIWLVNKSNFANWRKRRNAQERAWLREVRFKPTPGKHTRLPGADGGPSGIVLGVSETPVLDDFIGLPRALRRGTYAIDPAPGATMANIAVTGWGLGTYAFTKFHGRAQPRFATLAVPEKADFGETRRIIAATFFVRDLVNTPASDMGPAELADAAVAMARSHGARTRVHVGDELLENNFPAIHAVGQASNRAPRLIDLRWGKPGAPKLTLVGKGVCFDSGGLDIKPHAGMRLMKKDMGGAAHVLALAHMVMDAGLNVRLRVLIPAVDNSISGSAMRPGDIVSTRSGTTIEIGHTDAEGRVVLADALALADEDAPDLIVDCATLTGAARVALGTEIVPFFTDDDKLAAALDRAGETESDPLWRLPLWEPYRRLIKSSVGDITNSPDAPFGGALTAALFLQEFVAKSKSWVHFDMFAWNSRGRQGQPSGGEATGLRAIYAALKQRYG
jgi:leucyl aminopeptidase